MEALGKSFEKLDPTGFTAYAADQGNKDLQGYIDMMGTVNTNQNMVSGNLNANDCFTDGTVENMLKGHAAMSAMNVATADGEVAVAMVYDANGMVQTYVTPMNLNK